MRTPALFVVLSLAACGAEPATPDAGRVCDPGWTCPDCQNYVRLRDGGCFRLDPNACGPNRQRCGAGQVCASGSSTVFDNDAGENVSTKWIRCETLEP